MLGYIIQEFKDGIQSQKEEVDQALGAQLWLSFVSPQTPDIVHYQNGKLPLVYNHSKSLSVFSTENRYPAVGKRQKNFNITFWFYPNWETAYRAFRISVLHPKNVKVLIRASPKA